jgi:hypothetical protein
MPMFQMFSRKRRLVEPMTHYPHGYAQKRGEEREGVGHLMGLTGRNPAGHSMTRPVRDRASLGPIPATRTASRPTTSRSDQDRVFGQPQPPSGERTLVPAGLS